MTREEADQIARQAMSSSPPKSPAAGDAELEAIPGHEAAEPQIVKAEEEDLFDGILTQEELEAIRKAAREKVGEEKKKEIARAYMEEQLDLARREAGTMPGDEAFRKYMEEEVEVYVDLPRLRKVTGGELAPDPIMIDQQMFVAGRHYRVPRALGLYLNDLMDKARRHVRAVDGRSYTQYDERIGQMVYQGGIAAGGPGSPGFDAIHQRRT
jgi:hypothetical protein